MKKHKSKHTVYQPENTMDVEMTFQKTTPYLDGIPQKPDITFVVSDLDETKEIVTSISIKEAKQMVKGLKAIIKEVEG
ncbi:hypothetical protein BY457_11479 [Marinilabilia salmonicolor]|jgi:hypothetical protein|uniref:hypothetical protein n=1 Tax=Marinilabilia salmonicolor TaxID=989 RepID=UPI000D05385B|nr:hypothetical protein [Marinilabilia salmonicolor]PRY96695.1 hypothetical protein BY457_11479 [Marinilabilia salmonicolor]